MKYTKDMPISFLESEYKFYLEVAKIDLYLAVVEHCKQSAAKFKQEYKKVKELEKLLHY